MRINLGTVDGDTYCKEIDFNKAVIWKTRELSLSPIVVEQWFARKAPVLLRFTDTKHGKVYEVPYFIVSSAWKKKRVGQEEQYYFSITHLTEKPIMTGGGEKDMAKKTDDTEWKKVEMESGPTWDFETDTELTGVLISKEENVGPNNSMMYKLQQEDGTEIGVWGNTVLDGRLKKVEVGEEVKLVYLGKMTSPKTKREYNSFDVYHRVAPMKKVDEPDF